MDKVFTMLDPGAGGRFGNQVIAYCFAQSFAQKHDAILEIPEDSVLRKIFKINNPHLPKNRTPIRFGLDVIPNDYQLNQCWNRNFAVDIWGYFQNQRSIDFYSKKWIKENLIFQNWIRAKFPSQYGPYYACHMRRGDYVTQPERYCSISNSSFDKIIAKVNSTNNINMGYILTEENPIKDEFCSSMNLGWLPDFMCMVNSEILIRSNSTFSLVAGWFHQGTKIYAPLVEDKIGVSDVDFVEGNWPKCCSSKYHPVELTNLFLKEENAST